MTGLCLLVVPIMDSVVLVTINHHLRPSARVVVGIKNIHMIHVVQSTLTLTTLAVILTSLYIFIAINFLKVC